MDFRVALLTSVWRVNIGLECNPRAAWWVRTRPLTWPEMLIRMERKCSDKPRSDHNSPDHACQNSDFAATDDRNGRSAVDAEYICNACPATATCIPDLTLRADKKLEEIQQAFKWRQSAWTTWKPLAGRQAGRERGNAQESVLKKADHSEGTVCVRGAK